ncbi:formate/nitrite transporter family protein [Methyloprofundus sp.]|uniref:formate/nitrite transporter family protein n=1 Tax=Methyloprofundus sp. TaxID=2020875 RepID=UPI003D10999B
MDTENQHSKEPMRQHLSPPEVLGAMHREATWLFHLEHTKVMILALLGGGFITMGALFSVLLSAGVEVTGLKLLLQGLGFSTGFYMIILSRTVLFTEANVLVPASMLQKSSKEIWIRAFQFWCLALVGNVLGAYIVGTVIMYAQSYPESVHAALRGIIAKKMAYMEVGGVSSWFKIIVSGMFGNGLIGMAAFFAIMAKTLTSKFVPIFLVVSLFVAGNLQHSPANMGYFSLIMAIDEGPGWTSAFLWNIIPAGIGNIIGATLLVALPFWYSLSPQAPDQDVE